MVLDILKSDWANLFYIISIVLTGVTLLVLIQYASDTRLIATETQESNIRSIRPLILRSDWNEWKDIKFTNNGDRVNGKPLAFAVLKNVASNISGYIVIDGNKYTLLFGGNSISQIDKDTYRYVPAWGWMKPDTILYAVYKEDSKQVFDEPNQIYISYADIEGNRYYTTDDESLNNQQSFREIK